MRAVEIGCEGSEFDVRMTADDVLVLAHDAVFDGLDIEQLNYAELSTLTLPNGEPLPTVEALLREGMKQRETKMIFEMKPSDLGAERSLQVAERSVQLVHELGAQGWVDYISFDYAMLERVLELDPDARVAFLGGTVAPAVLESDGFYGADYNYDVFQTNPEWLQELEALGLTSNVWTVNTLPELQWLIEQDVDFITTDEPEVLLDLIAAGG